MHNEPVQVYYIDCPVNTPVYSRENKLIGYTDGFKARPTATSNGSICLSTIPITENSIDKTIEVDKQLIWLQGRGVYIVGIGIKLYSNL